MKYWLIGLGISYGFYLTYDFGHGQTFSQSELQSNCIKILNQFISNHPNNLHCEILTGYSTGGNNLYVYTDENSNVLSIDPITKIINFKDKNGNNLPLPVK